MTAQCQACAEPAPQGLSICNRCAAQAKYHLIDQSAHRIELVTALTRMTRMQAPNDGGRATDPALSWAALGPLYIEEGEDDNGVPLRTVWDAIAKNPIAVPYARKAADALHSQRSLLVSWCRDLNEVHNIPLPPNTIATMSIHLHDHMRILRKHPAGGEFVAELRKLVQDIMRVIDLPAFRRFFVGLCIQDNQECPGQVWAFLSATEDIPPILRCAACFTEWASPQWMKSGPLIKAKTESALILRRSEKQVA